MEYNVLHTIVDGIKGTRFASIDTISEVKLKGGKKNPLQNRVFKKTEGSVVILTNTPEQVYANMVKKRLVEEGKDFKQFELKPRTWGERIGNTCFIEHKGEKYLEVLFVSSGNSSYLVDGVETKPEEIEGLEIEKKINVESQGGLDNKVIIRTYKTDSVLNIRVNGEEYKTESE